MKYRWDKKFLYWGLTGFLVIISSISFFLLISRMNSVASSVQSIINTLKPVIYGFCIAYLLIPVMNFVERHVKKGVERLGAKKKRGKPLKVMKISRIISVCITMFLTILFIVTLIILAVPQISNAITMMESLSVYITNLEQWLTKTLENNPDMAANISSFFENISISLQDWLTENLLPQAQDLLISVTSGVWGAIVALKNIVIGIIISVYIMLSKDLFIAQIKRVCYALLRPSRANGLISVTRKTHKIFGGFIIGKLFDSLIVAIICFVIMSLFGWPFPVLISVIIGLTNIIPFFGPFIGAVPCSILLLLIDPRTCLYFIIFIVILQQVDGNIIGPRILGNSTGISGFWVVVAILVGGGLFGFVGMLIGVPTLAVIYTLARELLEKRLKNKNLPVKTPEYHNLDYIDQETGEAVNFGESEKSDSGKGRPPKEKAQT